VTYERASVHIPDDGNIIALEIGLGRFLGAPIRGDGRKFADDERFDVRVAGLFVIGIGADIADVWIGEADDLAGVTWVSKNFLVTGEAGIENNFAAAAGPGARGAPRENAPVLKREVSWLADFGRQL